jgi:hypothetical protein
MIYGAVAVWLLLFIVSFVVFATTEPTDSGFTKGLNRVGEWFKWQSAALVAAAALFVFARSARDKLTRQQLWISYSPLIVSGALAGIFVLGAIYVLFFPG